MDANHRLLKRQLKRHFGASFVPPPEWAGFLQDIDRAYAEGDTDRKMLERTLDLSSNELVEANAELQAILNAIPDLLFHLDRQGTVLSLKSKSENGGFPLPPDAIGKNIQGLFPRPNGDRFLEAVLQVVEEKKAVQLVFSLPLDGEEGFFEARLVPLHEDQVIAMVRTITEQKRAEDLLAGQNRILEMFATGSTLEDILTKLVLLIESLSEGMLGSILLLDREGKRLKHIAAPNLPEEYCELIDERPIGPAAGSCGTAAYRGEPVMVSDIRTDPLWDDYREFAERFHLRACWSTPIISRQGRVLGTFAMYYKQPKEHGPHEKRLIELTSHIARIAIERKQLEEQVREAQKMEAFGQLAGGIAHDFNNLMTVIMGGVSILRFEGFSEEERISAIDDIFAASERAANLTQQLLTFSRKHPIQPRNLNLNDVLLTMTKMFQRVISENIVLETQYAPGGAAIYADPGMIEQALMNLAVNSRDAMPQGGRLSLSVSVVSPASHYGEFVRLTVQDTGKGIAPEILPQIFEPFFTTKEVGKGTGLGLATVFGIVEQHQGWIEVESRLAAGTTFHLYFPRVPWDPQKIREMPQQVVLPKGKETLLVVEDESEVLELMRAFLTRQGYTVFSASSGVQAITIWEEKKHTIDLLLTDIVMPGGLDGKGLARRLKAEKPALKVLLCSGYHEGTSSGIHDDLPKEPLLEKPFSQSGLVKKVREVLDGGQG